MAPITVKQVSEALNYAKDVQGNYTCCPAFFKRVEEALQSWGVDMRFKLKVLASIDCGGMIVFRNTKYFFIFNFETKKYTAYSMNKNYDSKRKTKNN